MGLILAADGQHKFSGESEVRISPTLQRLAQCAEAWFQLLGGRIAIQHQFDWLGEINQSFVQQNRCGHDIGTGGHCQSIILTSGSDPLFLDWSGSSQPIEVSNDLVRHHPSELPWHGIAHCGIHVSDAVTIRQSRVRVLRDDLHGNRVDVRPITTQPLDLLLES